MKQEDAKQSILALWPQWVAATNTTNADGTDGFRFFGYIQKEYSHLLVFKTPSNDKWQVVHNGAPLAKHISERRQSPSVLQGGGGRPI